MIFIVIVILLIVAVLASFGISFYMFLKDHQRAKAATFERPLTVPDIPSYQLSSWIDDEIAARKLYRKPDISAAELAAELGISERRLKRAINNAYNKTVSDYLDDRRIQAACRLLREQPDMTLEAISIETGFTSQNAFHTAFKNTMGQTPGQYRIMITQQKK